VQFASIYPNKIFKLFKKLKSGLNFEYIFGNHKIEYFLKIWTILKNYKNWLRMTNTLCVTIS